jgi:ABC-type glutathione transport system ATPase component
VGLRAHSHTTCALRSVCMQARASMVRRTPTTASSAVPQRGQTTRRGGPTAAQLLSRPPLCPERVCPPTSASPRSRLDLRKLLLRERAHLLSLLPPCPPSSSAMTPAPAAPAPAGTPLLSVTSLSRFVGGGRCLWDGVSFDLQPTDIWFIRGPSGVGKTLLLRALAQLDYLEHTQVRGGRAGAATTQGRADHCCC